MDNLASWNSRLNAVYEKVPFVCNKCEIVEDGVKFEYLDAESLSEHLDSMLQGKSRLHLIGLWSF